MQQPIICFLMVFLGIYLDIRAQESIKPDPKNPDRNLAPPVTPQNGYPGDIDRYTWNAGTWDLHSHEKVTYNDLGQITSEEINYMDGQSFRKTYGYDRFSEIILTEKLVDGQWVSYLRERWEYSNVLVANIELYLAEEFVNGEWVVVDGFDDILEFLDQQLKRQTHTVFNPLIRQFEPVERITYTHYESGLISSTTTEVYDNGTFVIQNKEENFYLPDNRLNYVLSSYWIENRWFQNGKYEYTWTDDRNRRWTYSTRTSETSDWDPRMRYTGSFDDHGNQTEDIYENFSDGGWKVKLGTKNFLAYAGMNLIERIIQEWVEDGLKSGSGDWVNTIREVYSDFYSLGISNLPQVPLEMTCFPVPSIDRIHINVPSTDPGSKILELINLSGQSLRKEVFSSTSNTLTWDIRDLPAGLYLVRLADRTHKPLITKIIKE